VYANASGGQTALLTTKIGREVRGLTYEIVEPLEPWPTYTLIGAPDSGPARLLVNGVERIPGYRGHQDWLEHRGVMFGVASLFTSTGEAEGLVRMVRFEIAGPAAATTKVGRKPSSAPAPPVESASLR
jgi:hypothetical protein